MLRRRDEFCIPGFNLVVIDVDGQISIQSAKWLLSDYTYILYKTKRHTDKQNRFRIVMPLSHELALNAEEFKQFMTNLYAWLPFEVDDQTGQRARKWLSNETVCIEHQGELLDALLFIPQTKKSEERRKIIDSQQSMSNVERWFANNTGIGNRSNHLIRYGYMLVDSGMAFDDIKNRILAFNGKLQNKLDESEVYSTIMQTVSKAIHKRDTE